MPYFSVRVTVESDSVRFALALRSAIAWPVGVIFVTAVLLLLLTVQLFEYIGWSDHSYEVLAETRFCENQVNSVQNQVRGFVITGDTSFISSLDQKSKDLQDGLTQLKALVQDNPPQAVKVQEVIDAKEPWLNLVQGIVAQQPQPQATNVTSTIEARQLMDQVMDKFKAFTAVEDDLRDQRLHAVRRMKQILAFAGSALFIVLTLAVGQLVRRHFILLANNYRSAMQVIAQRQVELEEQKEWFRVTLSSIGDGVIVTNETGRIVFMNGEAEMLTGWKNSTANLEALPDVFKIVNEETRQTVENPVAKVFREKKVVGLANHTILLSADGREWPIEDSAAPIYNPAGQILGVVLVFHNATDLRRAQKTLKAHSDDLEKKVAERTLHLQQTVMELEAFSYTISHDLRSPLRAMQGFAQALEEDYGNNLEDRGKNYLNRIKNAAERLDRLIQDLLAYTRISREAAPLVPLDVDKITREIIAHYPNFHSPDAKIEIKNVLPKIMGREAALTQVLSNLLGNAAKFMAADTTPQIKVWSEDRGSLTRIWIEDNGIGVAARDFDRIFQMFIQINEPTLYGGTGVGLAIVKKAVQTMKGSVGLESKEGLGSKFWVELIKA